MIIYSTRYESPGLPTVERSTISWKSKTEKFLTVLFIAPQAIICFCVLLLLNFCPVPFLSDIRTSGT